jgi:hypothetical protein
MSKIELKYLTPYMPYGVMVGDGRTPFDLTEHNFSNVYQYITTIYLRPMSELESYFKILWDKKDQETREFLDSDLLHSFDYLEVEYIHRTNVNYLPVGLYNLLLKHQFDVFNLFEKGFADKISNVRNVKSI